MEAGSTCTEADLGAINRTGIQTRSPSYRQRRLSSPVADAPFIDAPFIAFPIHEPLRALCCLHSIIEFDTFIVEYGDLPTPDVEVIARHSKPRAMSDLSDGECLNGGSRHLDLVPHQCLKVRYRTISRGMSKTEQNP